MPNDTLDLTKDTAAQILESPNRIVPGRARVNKSDSQLVVFDDESAGAGDLAQTLDSKLSSTMNTATSLRVLYLACALYAAAPAPAVGQAAANDESMALATVAAFHDALNAGNAEAALRLLAPDAVVMEGGELESRTQYQERHLAADIQFARSVKTARSGMSAAVSGDVAWVTSTSVTQGSYKGRRIALNGAELMVLAKAPTGWLIRAIHWSSHKRK